MGYYNLDLGNKDKDMAGKADNKDKEGNNFQIQDLEPVVHQ